MYIIIQGSLFKKPAATYSPAFAVPSAQVGLTSVFEMGTGEPYRYNHPKYLNGILYKILLNSYGQYLPILLLFWTKSPGN